MHHAQYVKLNIKEQHAVAGLVPLVSGRETNVYANWLLRANDAMCIMSSLTILRAGYNIYSTTTRYVNQITELKVSWRYLVCCRGGGEGGGKYGNGGVK